METLTYSSVAAVASMMNTMLCRKLFVVAAAPMNSILCCKVFVIHPFYFRNVFSTEAHSQTLFSDFASTKPNMPLADINRMFKLPPQLQKLRTLHNAQQFIHLFEKRGFTEVQIANIMRSQPHLIGVTERVLESKIKLLEDFGFVDQNLVKLLRKNPSMLNCSLKKELLPKMELMKNVFQSQDLFIKALLKSPIFLSYSLEKILKPSLAFWEGWVFCGAGLVSFLQVHPCVLSRTSLTPAQVDLIHKIGIDKESKMFKYIVAVVAVSRVETLEAKIENFKLCGLLAEETWQLLGAAPLVLNLSEENVSEKMKFLVNNMELPANYVVKHYKLLTINLEKTMKPRFLVWQKIKSVNALELPLLTVLTMPETRFVNNIIKGHPESKILSTIYENAITNAFNRIKSSTKNNFRWKK